MMNADPCEPVDSNLLGLTGQFPAGLQVLEHRRLVVPPTAVEPRLGNRDEWGKMGVGK